MDLIAQKGKYYALVQKQMLGSKNGINELVFRALINYKDIYTSARDTMSICHSVSRLFGDISSIAEYQYVYNLTSFEDKYSLM